MLERARQLSAAPLLVRLDGGNDALENIAVIEAHNEHHEGTAPVHYLIKWNPRQERPERWLAYAEEYGSWSEPRPGKRVALFEVRETRVHAGHDYIERLPSGKFATNALVLACAQLACNLLRWIGQNGLLGPDAPPRQAPAHPHRDAGARPPGRPADLYRAPHQARLRLPLPGRADLSAPLYPIGLYVIAVAATGSPLACRCDGPLLPGQRRGASRNAAAAAFPGPTANSSALN